MMRISYLLFLIVILVSGCDVSDDFVNESNRDIKIQILDKSMLQNHPLALQKLREIHQESESMQRIIQADSFAIDTDYCKYLVVNGIESYTFGVYRQDPPKNLLENLVLTKHRNDSISAMLYQYQLTKPEQDSLLQGVMVPLNDRILVHDISDKNLISDVYGKLSSHDLCWDYNFVTVPGNPCIQGNHMFGDPDCSYTNPNSQYYNPALGPTPPTTNVVLIPSSCGGGSGSNPGGTNPYNPAYGSGSTSPTGGPPKELIDRPCDKLKNLTSSHAYKQAFKEIDTSENHSAQQETGFGETNGYVSLQPLGSNGLAFPPGCKNFTHVHNNHPEVATNGDQYDAAVKIHSPKDLLTLIKCQNNNLDPKDSFAVVISNEGIFALSITEKIIIDSNLNSNWQKFVESYETESQFIVANPNFNSEERKKALQKLLLEKLKKLGLQDKLALFEGQVENKESNDFNLYNINWTRVTLERNKLERNPC